jgi:hypothetical protein
VPTARPHLERLEDRLAPAFYNVNTTQDLSIAAGVNNATGVINGTAGVVTLRSAIQAANNTPGGNAINLTVPGTYLIALSPTTPNQTDNQAGEFAILPQRDLTIANTSGGSVAVDANNLCRVFDINPAGTNNPATASFVVMEGFTIENGRAFDATGANPDGPAASGGGIRVQGNASLTLTGMTISNNSATADGGGVSMENTVDALWSLIVVSSRISHNSAGDAGGGLEEDGTGTVLIVGSVITGNSSVNQGAGIWLDAIGNDSASLTMTGCTVSGNRAINGATGGIGNSGNNTFLLPSGEIGSGAVTIITSAVFNNFGGNGGVGATGGGGFGDSGTTGKLVVEHSTFANNSSTGNGGGIEEQGPSTAISDSTITGNTTLQEGGGLAVTSATFVLNNTVVAGNFSNGGNMNSLGVDPDVLGAVTSGSADFIGIGGPGLTGITNGTNSNRVGTAAAPLNPLLGALQNNGGPTLSESPLPGSPLIDAGINALIPIPLPGTLTVTDQRGFNRIVNNTVDIGAIEFQPPATTTTLMLSAPTLSSGQPETLTATVTATAPGSNSPQGTVTFFSGTTPLGTVALTGGTAALTFNPLPGTAVITALYNGFTQGDFAFTASPSNAVTLTVVPVATTTTLTASATTLTAGQPETLQAMVTPSTTSSGTPQGSVTFFSGATPLGTVTLTNGTASLTFIPAAGTAILSALYNGFTQGDLSFTESSSNAVTLTVIPPPGATAITIVSVSHRYTLLSQLETVTALVTSGGQPVGAGQVTFTDGGQSQTVGVGGDGMASATFTFGLFQEQPSSHTVAATYNGTAAFAASSTSSTAGSTLTDFLLQLAFDFVILERFGLLPSIPLPSFVMPPAFGL